MFSKFRWKPTIFWMLVGFTLVVFTFYYQLQNSWSRVSYINHDYIGYDLEAEEPADPSQECKIPKIHPFDPSIIPYLSPAKPIKCKERQVPLTFIDHDGYLRYNETAVQLSGYKDKALPCDYQEIFRPEGEDSTVGYSEKMKLPPEGIKLQTDFVFVSCYNFAGIAFYTNIHLHIVPKVKSYQSAKRLDKKIYNVLILGIDSLSRLSFIRNLPKTYRYLTKEMESFVFRGMTKVGDNTFPNLGAILTGKSVLDGELPSIKSGEKYDKWPCIWKNFSKYNYATLYAEDRPDIALFNYLRNGFKNPPTDHYLRPFWLAVQSSALHRLSSNMCFGTVPKHLLQLNYTSDFAIKYFSSSRPYFGFSFFVELSHDYMSQVSVADLDLTHWLEHLHKSGYFERTFFIFFSDHGHRFDNLRATLIGRIEERMPFFALYIPPSIRKSHPEIISRIKENQGRLTSPYDTYFTLIDILKYSNEAGQLGEATSSRGTTLFGPISANRTCEAAGIPDHYCTCEEEKSLDNNDYRSVKAAEVLVDTINALLETADANFTLCSKLNLSHIKRTELIVPNRKVVINSRIYFGNLVQDSEASGMMSKLRIIIQAEPGGGLFEGTLLHREDDDSMSVLGDISRINKYGTQSYCIKDAVLRKYCYCLNLQFSTPTSR